MNTMLDSKVIRSVIQQWNTNRLDLFALSEPDENLLFHGVMRFYFQDDGQKVATKCIRVASDATVADVIETLIEKFRPDMRMLSVPNYALYEVYVNGEERKLDLMEKPLLVQLNWHMDDREGRFLLKNIDQKTKPIGTLNMSFKRKCSKREQKEPKKKEHLDEPSDTEIIKKDKQVAEKLYSELPETPFTRSISNPEAVMRRRRQQKLEKKLQQFRSRDGGPDTGGTLKIYGESLCPDVPYKTLLLSIRDCAQVVVKEMLSKYGLNKADPSCFCLVQVNSDGTECILDDDECPLSILMNHDNLIGSIMFHVRRRPTDPHQRRRKKKPLSSLSPGNSSSVDRDGAVLVEITHSGDCGRRIKLGNDPIEVGSANTNTLQLFGPSIQTRHCLISLTEGFCTVTPLHADALTFVNGHHITQPSILHNGSVVTFGRVASFRFLDQPVDKGFNHQSRRKMDSFYFYEGRSTTSPGPWCDEDDSLSMGLKDGEKKSKSLSSGDSNTLLVSSSTQDHQVSVNGLNCYKTDLGVEGETKSVSSFKSNDSETHDLRLQKNPNTETEAQEAILPAVLEFPEIFQEMFLCRIITELDVNMPHFKLAPVYTLYLCARYRASTHYRPELQPTERAHKLTLFLHHVANLILSVIQDNFDVLHVLAFWMANSSELLHFLKSDRHISAFSIQAQELLSECVQIAFRNLVNCYRNDLKQALNQFLIEEVDHDSAAGLVLGILSSSMALLRRCRVNAALTIQLFSQLFHYINITCFNKVITNPNMCTAKWGNILLCRIQLLELWAERQGLELAADCHLSKINQCAQFLQAPKTSMEEIQKLTCSCFRLNSLQISVLLQQEKILPNLTEHLIKMARSVADELIKTDGKELCLEEPTELHLALLLPDDGFSSDVVRGLPMGLIDFLNPLQSVGMCRLATQPTSNGLWTVYMHRSNIRSSSTMSEDLPYPEVKIIKLQKNCNGMGLSIVAAKGAGQERLGIYIKSVVSGGAADIDGRLQAGDQLLCVDGQALVGITQEKAADYLLRTGPIVTLEVAKQGAIYHGLAALLQQPSPIIQRGGTKKRSISRKGIEPSTEHLKSRLQPSSCRIINTKSAPSLHNPSNAILNSESAKSLSTQNLANSNEQGFYQNLNLYRIQNQGSQVTPNRLQFIKNYIENNSEANLNTPFEKHPESVTVLYPKITLLPDKKNNSTPHILHSLSQLESNRTNCVTNINKNVDENMQLFDTKLNSIESPIFSANDYFENINNSEQVNQIGINQNISQAIHNIDAVRTVPPSYTFATITSSQSMQNISLNKQGDNSKSENNQNNQLHLKRCIVNTPPNIGMKSGSIDVLTTDHFQTKNVDENLFGQKSNPLDSQHNWQAECKQNTTVFTKPTRDVNDCNDSIIGIEIKDSSLGNADQLTYLSQTNQAQSTDIPPLPPTITHPLFKNISQNYILQPLVERNHSDDKFHQAKINYNDLDVPPQKKEDDELCQDHSKLSRNVKRSGHIHLYRSGEQEEQLKTMILGRGVEYQKPKESNAFLNKTECRIGDQILKDGCVEYKDNKLHSDLQSQNMFKYHLTQKQPIPISLPKSILKNNRSDCLYSMPLTSALSSKPSCFVGDRSSQTDLLVSTISNNMLTMNINVNTKNVEKHLPTFEAALEPLHNDTIIDTISPPIPPERSSSHVIMLQPKTNMRDSKSFVAKPVKPENLGPNDEKVDNETCDSTNLTFHHSQTIRDNKKVSFGDEDEQYSISLIDQKQFIDYSDEMFACPNSQDLSFTHEVLLQPTHPHLDVWNATSQTTPGVIGAQEIYRDPRQRRLAEQQQKQQSNNVSVPEKLSFKEKMKMFALEAGDDQTPKDKLKISRAQRDIDAVY